MTKEQKIDLLLAFLAPLIFEGKKEETDAAPQITFLSATGVQIEEFPGLHLPVNKEYTANPLKTWLEAIVNYNYGDERKNWEECCADEDPDEDMDIGDTYDPTLCPGHIYHTIYQLNDLIENTREQQGSEPIDHLLYLRDEKFLEFLCHTYDLKECYPSPEEQAVAAFGNMENAIRMFDNIFSPLTT
jgi:hypothetical protein